VEVIYRIVDKNGNEIRKELFEKNVELLVKVKSVMFVDEGVIITYEYLHGE
jgi:hypothetical protein